MRDTTPKQGSARTSVVNRAFRLQHVHWCRLVPSLLLPLLLVVAQQGALLHELSHYRSSETPGESKKQSPRGDVCELCLAFAQIGSAALASNQP
jgi:hypothetical protein